MRCRTCGRTPEQVLEAAKAMRSSGAVIMAGFFFRTRWRETVPTPSGARDLVCWFCQLWAYRYFDELRRGWLRALVAGIHGDGEPALAALAAALRSLKGAA